MTPEEWAGYDAENYEDLWNRLKSYLDHIERKIQNLVEKRHIFEWIHVSRRIGVMLSEMHERIKDATTVALVRRTLDLAILNYANISDEFKPVSSKNTPLKDILSGHLLGELKNNFKNKKEALEIALSFQKHDQWVLRDFSPEFIIDHYKLEGLCYEYWQVTARMRLVGKLAAISFESAEDRESKKYHIFATAIRYDERNMKGGLDSTLAAGAFIQKFDNHTLTNAIVPAYNCERLAVKDLKARFYENFLPEFTANFLISVIDLLSIRDSHAHLQDQFYARYGYSIDDAFAAIATVCIRTIIPSHQGWEDPTDTMLARAYQNLGQRGYSIGQYSVNDIKLLSEYVINSAKNDLHQASQSGTKKAIDDLVLDRGRSEKIGLWSGGRWFPIIPCNDWTLISTCGLGEHIARMFVGVRDDLGQKGTKFEDVFRSALSDRDLDVPFFGELAFTDGSRRELDCSARVANKLYIFECRAMERPLDYDLAKPSVLIQRKQDLEAKAQQVTSLEKKIRENPKGKNYDFSWAKEIHSFVVSPFVEFSFDNNDLYFSDESERIISFSEALCIFDK